MLWITFLKQNYSQLIKFEKLNVIKILIIYQKHLLTCQYLLL
ncbi:hypothetical protein MCAV_02420 [[Mycoplasma] cavipharyngis]